MHVAVIGQFDWYGCMGSWVADAWEGNGHEVDRIDRKEDLMAREFWHDEKVDMFDLIIYVDCSEDYSENILDTKTPKVFWSLDAHMPGGAERSVNIATKCDLVFSSNYEAGVKVLEKFGIESYLLPVTFNNKLVKNIGKRRNIDIAMIGHPNSAERIKLWKLLHDNYNAFTGKANTRQEYIEIMNSAKIIINQPTEPWDTILNNRFFEALSYGKVLLQKRLKTKLIEKLGFREGVDFEYWNNFDELKVKIDIHLKDKRNSGINPMVMKYSMLAQCSKMENIILSKFYDRL